MLREFKTYLASSVLFGASLLSSCSFSEVPNNSRPIVNPDCIVGSAADYARDIGFPLDVGVYDSNLNRHVHDFEGVDCFTRFEREMVDELQTVWSEGANLDILERIVHDYPTVGPATVHALRLSWDAYLEDSVFDESIGFYEYGVLGWLALDIATGVSLPGTYLKETNGENLTPYPIDENIQLMGPPDWNPSPGVSSSFLDALGFECTTTLRGQPYPDIKWQSSADVFYSQELRGTPRPIRSALPPGARVHDMHVVELDHILGGTFNEGILALKYDVHPDDHYLIGFESVFEYMAHTVPDESNLSSDRDKWFFGKEDFSVKIGDKVSFGEILAYQNPRFDFTGQIYDHTIFVAENRPELKGIGSPFDKQLGFQTLDYLSSYFVHTLLGVPREFLAFPSQYRYGDKSIHGCD